MRNPVAGWLIRHRYWRQSSFVPEEFRRRARLSLLSSSGIKYLLIQRIFTVNHVGGVCLVCTAHPQTHNVYIHTAHSTTVCYEADMPQEVQQVPAKHSVSTGKLSECHALPGCIHI